VQDDVHLLPRDQVAQAEAPPAVERLVRVPDKARITTSIAMSLATTAMILPSSLVRRSGMVGSVGPKSRWPINNLAHMQAFFYYAAQ
jgi:hypothetical protein